MASVGKYISVLAPATAAGDVVLNIKSINRATPITFNITVPIETTASVVDIADLIKSGIDAQLVSLGYNYTGIPSFVYASTEWPFTFRTYQTDHIINIWSQTPYRLSVVSAPAGVTILTGSSPTLITLARARALAPIIGTTYASGATTYDDATLALALESASDEIISQYLGSHPVAASTFLHQEFGFNQNGFQLFYRPVIGWDIMAFRFPSFWNIAVPESGQLTAGYFSIDPTTGYVTFAIRSGARPMRPGNVAKITYVSGKTEIPTSVEREIVRVGQYIKIPVFASRMKSASTQLDLVKREEMKAVIEGNLSGVMMI